jgi:hypothetical protein
MTEKINAADEKLPGTKNSETDNGKINAAD